jgi:hypothetical protein
MIKHDDYIKFDKEYECSCAICWDGDCCGKYGYDDEGYVDSQGYFVPKKRNPSKLFDFNLLDATKGELIERFLWMHRILLDLECALEETHVRAEGQCKKHERKIAKLTLAAHPDRVAKLERQLKKAKADAKKELAEAKAILDEKEAELFQRQQEIDEKEARLVKKQFDTTKKEIELAKKTKTKRPKRSIKPEAPLPRILDLE